MSELSPESGFDFTAFGAVTEVRLVTNKDVAIPADRRAAFARAAKLFASGPNNQKASFEMATPAEAEMFRAQVATYAREMGLTAYIPKFVAEHTVTKTDKASGKQTTKVVPANGIPAHFNVGTNVTFRFSIPDTEDIKAEAQTRAPGPVTVTQGTPKPTAPKSRGQQVLGK